MRSFIDTLLCLYSQSIELWVQPRNRWCGFLGNLEVIRIGQDGGKYCQDGYVHAQNQCHSARTQELLKEWGPHPEMSHSFC